MVKNKLIFFSVSFLIFFMVAYSTSFYQQSLAREKQTKDMTHIIETFEDQFENFIDGLLLKGIVVSEYFPEGDISNKKYDSLARSIIIEYNDILGVNLVDLHGKIIKVYPYATNKMTLGKDSQNYPYLLESLKRNEEFWLSPPFPLYQGPFGFILYIPIHKSDKLTGWLAPVISLNDFFKRFIRSDFFTQYNLIINDVETNRNYFETDQLPKNTETTLKREFVIRGRKINFTSWPRGVDSPFNHLGISLSLAILLSFVSTYLYIFFEGREKQSISLDEVESLLRQSINDASGNFTLIQNQMELLKLGTSHISHDRLLYQTSFMAILLEQIKILKRIANKDESAKLEKMSLSVVLSDVLLGLRDKLEEKRISLIYLPIQFTHVEVCAHKWLLTHGVFNTILRQIIFYATEDSKLEISHTKEKYFHHIQIQDGAFKLETSNSNTKHGDKNFINARRILHLFKGDIVHEIGLDGGQVITIILPVMG